MTECNLNGYAGIVAEVNVLLYIVAGCNEVCEFIAPGCAAVHGYVYTDDLCSVCGILTCHVEGELAAAYKCGGNQPVIGSESTNIVDVGLRVHYAEAFVNGEACIECPLPVVAVAVLVNPSPAVCCGIALEVPAGGNGCIRIEVLCGDGGVSIDGCIVVIPSGEFQALMSGSFGEVCGIEDGACFYDHGADDCVVAAINKGYGEFGSFGSGNFYIVDAAEAKNLSAAADDAAFGNLSGCGINNIEGTGGVVVCPEQLVGVHVPSHGLNILEGNAGGTDLGAVCGLEVDTIEDTGLIFDTVCIAFVVDCEGCNVAGNIEVCDMGQSTEGAVNDVETTDLLCVIGCNSIHDIGIVVVCHAKNDLVAGGDAGIDGGHAGSGVDGVEPGIAVSVVVAVDGGTCGCSCEGGGRSAKAYYGRGIIVSECAPHVSGTGRIVCDVANKVCGGQSLGYGYGCDAGNAINGGYGDGGGAFRNAGYNAVCINGRDGFFSDCKGNALVECLCGENGVLHGRTASCGNGNVLNCNSGGLYGGANIYVVEPSIVAGLIEAAVLLVGPREGVLAFGKCVCVGSNFLNAVPLDDLGAVYIEFKTVPDGAGAFAKAHIIELDDVTCCRGYGSGNGGGRGSNIYIGAYRCVTAYDPRIISLGHEGDSTAGYIQRLVKSRCIRRLYIVSRTGLGN